MRTHARWLAPLFAASLLLAACGDDDSETSTDTTEAGVTVAPDDSTATTAGDTSDTTTGDIVVAEPGVVQVAEVGDLGEALVDADGMTLYVYSNDTAGEPSTCTDPCSAGWPPYLADEGSAGDGVTAEVGTVENEDGAYQVTVNGLPVYTFAGDAAAGEANGQGTLDVWWAIGPDGEAIDASSSSSGDTTATTEATTATTAASSTETTDDPYDY